MSVFLILAFLFSMGSMIGWGIEVIFRRFFSAKHWVNPGFLTGPYLPLYGSSLCVLYSLAQLESILPIASSWIRKLFLFLLMAIVITGLEYIAGLIFIRGMKIKLWDYTDRWGNIKGIICPLFSFFWILLSAIYYFFVHPYILSALQWLSENLAFSFGIGFFYGIFILDFAYATQILVKIRAFAAEKDIIVRLEELKEDIRTAHDHRKHHFFGTTHRLMSMREYLETYQKKHFPTRKQHSRYTISRKKFDR